MHAENASLSEHDGTRHRVSAGGLGDVRLVGNAWLFDPEKHQDAHAARGYFLWTHGQGFPHEQAIEELKLALELDPQLEEAYQRLLPIYAHAGLLDEAIALIEQARSTNPLDDDWRLYRAMALLWQGEYAEALAVYDGLRNAPVGRAPFTSSLIAWAQFQLGKTNEAWITIHKYLAARPEDIGGLFAGVQAMLFAKAGEQGKAEEQITNAIGHSKGFGHFHHTAYNIASAYALMNKTTQPFIGLRRPWTMVSIATRCS